MEEEFAKLDEGASGGVDEDPIGRGSAQGWEERRFLWDRLKIPIVLHYLPSGSLPTLGMGLLSN